MRQKGNKNKVYEKREISIFLSLSVILENYKTKQTANVTKLVIFAVRAYSMQLLSVLIAAVFAMSSVSLFSLSLDSFLNCSIYVSF